MSERPDLDARLEALTPEDLARGLEVFRGRLKDAEVANLQTCVRCGLCADSCHYHRADPVPEHVPAARLALMDAVFRRHDTVLGRLAPFISGARPLDKDMARAWVDAVFGRCSLCGRCTLECTMGLNLPRIFRAARAALGAMGLTPDDLQGIVDTSLASGNNMAISTEDWTETLAWIEEELQGETGDPGARIPVDKAGVEFLFTVNPREPKFFPLSLQASAKVFRAAGADWTVASGPGWDLTNYGLFNCKDDEAAAISEHLVAAMERLGCRTLVVGECGHGYAAARWEGPEWLKGTFPFQVKSVLEVMDEYLASGRIRVDPARNPEPLTLHDPCNLVRHGGICETQRRILRQCASTFIEMTPNRERNFCCGGGGGQLAMGRYKARRLRAGGVKARQIRDTGARVVVAPCHNCIDQIMELNKEYKLNVRLKTVTEVVAEALVLDPTVHRGDA
jgi:Fe-S oxidoreductase